MADSKNPQHKISEEEAEIREFKTMALKIRHKMTRPYDRKCFASLSREKKAMIYDIESTVILAMSFPTMEQNANFVHEQHAQNEFLTDQELIDRPLKYERALKDVYLKTGIAENG